MSERGEPGPTPEAAESQHDTPEALAAALGFAETAEMRELRSAVVQAALDGKHEEMVELKAHYQMQTEQLVDAAEDQARAYLAKFLLEAVIARDSGSPHYSEAIEHLITTADQLFIGYLIDDAVLDALEPFREEYHQLAETQPEQP